MPKHFDWTRLTLFALVAAVVVLWFSALELRGLYKPDEGRYAEIPREMLATGDWITPRLNGLKYFEKPPLQYWMTAAAFQVFGPDEWTARLWTALTGFLGLMAVAFVGARLFGPATGRDAALVLAGSWGYFVAAQYLTLDMGLTFFLAVAMLAFLAAQRPEEPPAAARRWMLVAWAAMALAVLSKGLIGLVLPGLALGAYVIVQRDASPLLRLRLAAGLAIFLAIAAPWFVLVQASNPEFFEFFFIREHFARFALPDHGRPGAWWYFLPVLLVSALPWTPMLPAVLLRAWRSQQSEGGGLNIDRFLVCWIVVIFAFFSASSSKLPAYILPVLPALALLLARHGSQLPAAVQRAPAVTLIAIGMVVGLAVPVLESVERFAAVRDLLVHYEAWLLCAATILVVAGSVAWYRTRHEGRLPFAPLMLGSLMALQLGMLGMHVFDEHHSSEELIERVAGEAKQFRRDVPFYSVSTFDHSVPFYLGRPVTLVRYRGEMAPGIASEPEKHVETVEDFERLWLSHDRAYAVMGLAQFEALRRAGLPMRVVDRDARSIVVER